MQPAGAPRKIPVRGLTGRVGGFIISGSEIAYFYPCLRAESETGGSEK